MAAQQGTPVATPPPAPIAGTSLSILQGQHPVPGYDAWFDKFLNEWGAANGVQVRVDRIGAADVQSALEREIETGATYDIVEHSASIPQCENGLLDLTDLVEDAERRYGPQLEQCRAQAFNPVTGRTFGFCHGYAALPGSYRQSLWSDADLPSGPASFDDLLDGGSQIWDGSGVPVGLGMSRNHDSNLAALAVIWAFGGSIQDEFGNVVINSAETQNAVRFMTTLFERCMLPDVLEWNDESNNQTLAGGRASCILESISRYRRMQEEQPDVASDISFRAPLAGPAGPDRAFTPSESAFTAMIPAQAANPGGAKAFLLHLTANYQAATDASKLLALPAFPGRYPALSEPGGPLDRDPFGSDPPDKLAALKTAANWTMNPGWPGPRNPLIAGCLDAFILPEMMATAARGEMSAEEAVTDAEAKLQGIAATWRAQGLMGGG